MKKINEEKIIKVLQETPDHRTDLLSLAEQIRQHDGVGSLASVGVGA